MVASRAWDISELAKSTADGCLLESRMAHAYEGNDTSTFFSQVASAMGPDSVWTALGEQSRTVFYSGLAFSMLSSAACGVNAKLAFRHASFPFKLWSVFTLGKGEPAFHPKDIPSCLLDLFSRAFLKQYGGDKWGTPECLAILMTIGASLRLDILRLECRNASIRRHVHKVVQTWTRAAEGMRLLTWPTHPESSGVLDCQRGGQLAVLVELSVPFETP